MAHGYHAVGDNSAARKANINGNRAEKSQGSCSSRRRDKSAADCMQIKRRWCGGSAERQNDVGTHLWRGTAALVVHWSEASGAAGAGVIGSAQHRRHTQLHSLLPCGSVVRSQPAECSSLMHCHPHPYITHSLSLSILSCQQPAGLNKYSLVCK